MTSTERIEISYYPYGEVGLHIIREHTLPNGDHERKTTVVRLTADQRDDLANKLTRTNGGKTYNPGRNW